MPTPGVIEFPAALDTPLSLIEVTNNGLSTLTGNISVSDLLIPVAEPGKFSTSGFVTLVDSLTAPTKIEILIYTSKSGSNLVVPPGGRGAQGTTAFAFSTGNFVDMRPTARHHTVLRDLLIAIEQKLGIGADTPGAALEALVSNSAGASQWRPLTGADVANVVREDDTAQQTMIGDLQIAKASIPSLRLTNTSTDRTAHLWVSGVDDRAHFGREPLFDWFDCHLTTGVVNFPQIPTGPSADPTLPNQLARKGYVDTRRTAFSFSFGIADPSTPGVGLVIPGMVSWLCPVGSNVIISRLHVKYEAGSHTSDGSVTFTVQRRQASNGWVTPVSLFSITLNNANNVPFVVFTSDVADTPIAAGDTLIVFISARSGTVTERDVSVILEGTQQVS